MGENEMKDFTRGPCGGEMLERTLGTADGAIRDEGERDAVFEHIAHCELCFDAFASYDPEIDAEARGEAEKEQPNLREIAVSLLKGALAPLGDLFLLKPDLVPVLGDEQRGVLEYELPFSGGALSLRLVHSGDGVTLEAGGGPPEARYHLMGRGLHLTEHPYDGVAVFRGVKPGNYILSRDYRDFVTIKVQG